MKKVIAFVTVFFAILVIAFIIIRKTSTAPYGTGAPAGTRVSAPFRYAGYTAPEYASWTKRSFFVPMSDGVDIAVDLFLPAGGPPRTSFPVVFIYNPYDRSYINPEFQWWEKAYMWVRWGITGPVLDQMIYSENQYLVSHGYAIAVADMRGTGASFGSQMPFMLRVGRDGKELVDWMARQQWCDGNVGMLGLSYRAWGELATAKFRPRALKCIMPEVIAITGYSEAFRPGGISALRWIDAYSDYLNAFNMNVLDKAMEFPRVKLTAPLIPTAPVIDEDGDGDLADEVPLMDKGDPTTFADDGPPRYRDGVERKSHHYYRATMEHRKNLLFRQVGAMIPYIDSIPDGYGVDSIDSSPGYFAKDIMASGIAVYHIGGWFDGFIRGTVGLFATMREKNPSRLLVGPKFHLPGVPDAYADLFSYRGDLKEQTAVERLRFFDRYLKGIDNGIDREPPMYIYVMNSGWRAEKEWPPARRVVTSFHFDGGGALTTGRAGEGKDQYKVDFTHGSSYGENDISRYLMMFTPEGLMERTAKDRQCLVYETAPLAADTEVTGHPVADLWVSSDRSDGDFYVYLTDVDEKGRSLYVTEGQLRAGWHRLHNDDDQARGAVNIRPDLPWHGYRKGGYEKNSLAGGRVLNLRFDLMPTSWVFRKGHRIRVAVAGADFPDFEINPVLSPENDPAKALPTTITVHRSPRYASRVELPVIPVAAK